jgi:nucleoid DNA-binding protein
VTKKEIVKQIADRVGLTQLKTKEIVQLTFDAIVETLLQDPDHRIELRNFGVFEVKRRKARKARNPRTAEKVDVPPKNVVTFKPGKEMEEKVLALKDVREASDEEDTDHEEAEGDAESAQTGEPTAPPAAPSEAAPPSVQAAAAQETAPASDDSEPDSDAARPAKKPRPRKTPTT